MNKDRPEACVNIHVVFSLDTEETEAQRRNRFCSP